VLSLSESKSGDVRRHQSCPSRLAQPIVSTLSKLQGRGPTGTLSYSIITRLLLDGNSASYHLCHVGRDAAVRVDSPADTILRDVGGSGTEYSERSAKRKFALITCRTEAEFARFA
jgi:hypothetical protein